MIIHVRQTSASTSEAAIRTHRVTIDRPLDKGGADQGPMGGELFLASIGGCFMSNLLAAIKAREVSAPAGVEVDVTGAIEGSPAAFTRIELNVSAPGLDRAVLDKLVEIAERGCIMVNTLRGKLDVRVRIAELV